MFSGVQPAFTPLQTPSPYPGLPPLQLAVLDKSTPTITCIASPPQGTCVVPLPKKLPQQPYRDTRHLTTCVLLVALHTPRIVITTTQQHAIARPPVKHPASCQRLCPCRRGLSPSSRSLTPAWASVRQRSFPTLQQPITRPSCFPPAKRG